MILLASPSCAVFCCATVFTTHWLATVRYSSRFPLFGANVSFVYFLFLFFRFATMLLIIQYNEEISCFFLLNITSSMECSFQLFDIINSCHWFQYLLQCWILKTHSILYYILQGYQSYCCNSPAVLVWRRSILVFGSYHRAPDANRLLHNHTGCSSGWPGQSTWPLHTRILFSLLEHCF